MKQHILAIDDDPDLIALIRAFLRDDGFEVTTAGDGTEGLALARQLLPDLIVLDLLMPDLSGMDVFKDLRSHPKTSSIPVVFLTGIEDEEFDRTALTLGAEGYLAKPCDPKELVDVVRETLAARA